MTTDRLTYVGSVLFRVIARARHEATQSLYSSYGLIVPKEAVVRLGWRERQRVDIWVDEEQGLLLIKAAPRPQAPRLT